MQKKKVVVTSNNSLDLIMRGPNGSAPRVVDVTGYSYLVEYPENWDLSSIVDRYSCKHPPHRDRLPSEVIILTAEQKDQFVEKMGKGARQATKDALSRYIDNPRLYPVVTRKLGSYMERLTFHPEHGFMQVAGQDHSAERQWVRSIIKSLV